MTYLIHRTADYWVIAQSFFLICCLVFIGIPVALVYVTLCVFIGITVFRREFPYFYDQSIKLMMMLVGAGLFLRLIRIQSNADRYELNHLQHFRAVFDT